MNYSEFAQKIRDKYPGSYDQVDDQTLSQKFVEKFPIYKQQVEFDQTQETLMRNPSIMQRLGSVNEIYKKSPAYQFSPMGISEKVMDVAGKGFNKLGEMAATGLASRGVNPYASAGIGTAIQMAPDLAMTLAVPGAGSKEIPNAAVGLERRALGFQKSLLKTPFARGQAAQAAKTALQENIVPALGNPEVALSRAQGLQGKTGFEIGKIRESVGPQAVDEIKANLESLRQAETLGNKGGKWDQIHAKINDALNGLKGIEEKVSGPPPPPSPLRNLVTAKGEPMRLPSPPKKVIEVDLSEVSRLKKQIADSVNWLNDNATQSLTKKITNRIENGITKILGKEGVDIGKYNALKLRYAAAKNMQRGLNNEVAAQQGNMGLSLPSMVMGAGQSPISTSMRMAITETLKRRGAGIGANLIKSTYQARNPQRLLLEAIQQSKKRKTQ